MRKRQAVVLHLQEALSSNKIQEVKDHVKLAMEALIREGIEHQESKTLENLIIRLTKPPRNP